MKIKSTYDRSDGVICIMDDESIWLRNEIGVWKKIRLSYDELQKEFDSIPIKDGRPWNPSEN